MFQAGEYEDAIDDNSTWSTGDWNADRDFTSADFVVSFQDGGYEQGPRATALAVPEPASILLLNVMLIALTARHRRVQLDLAKKHSIKGRNVR